MNYTNDQLKAALAKMLPTLIESTQVNGEVFLLWKAQDPDVSREFVLDTELLHLCWMVEETLPNVTTRSEYAKELYMQDEFSCPHDNGDTDYYNLFDFIHATWQQRVVALCKVKGVEIV